MESLTTGPELENSLGPKRRFAAPQRFVGNLGLKRHAWCMLETTQLTCSPLSRSPNNPATAMAAQ